MNHILTNRKKFFRQPLADIDEDKILFYDIETDHQFSPYAKLKSIAVQYGLLGKPEMVVGSRAVRDFKQKISSPDIIKVDFNGINFDRTVCHRHGYPVHPQNAHDLFLLFKTIAPGLPAYSLKFISFYYLADPHFPEMKLNLWCAENDKPMHLAPWSILSKYNKHDVTQTKNLFRLGWDIAIRDEFWNNYLHDLMMGEPLMEMEIEGGMFLDADRCVLALHHLQKTVQQQTLTALRITDGKVQNANSSQQLGRYFHEFDELEMELTSTGEFKIDKAFLLSCRDSNPLAECAFKIREANASMKYFENYLTALDDPTYKRTRRHSWIPIQFSVSSARTRRFTSQSLYKLNFQNPSEEADEVQLIPSGQLGFWFDATQIENVVHIYESGDAIRRAAYEDDLNWNEYVWLCNVTFGVDRTKDEWDNKKLYPSQVVPHWSQYKEKKSVKLGMNFGLGIKKYCKMNGLQRDVGDILYAGIHEACPAIHELQNNVRTRLRRDGFVTDALGWRYTGSVDEAYKVVAYLIQGCGTAGLPKLQIRANWETLRNFDKEMPRKLRSHKCGLMNGTTHDENGGRIDLRLGDENILQCLQSMNRNMTKKFSHYFDDIPLRSKMYLSKTTVGNAIECDINDTKKILQIINCQACSACNGTGKSGTDNDFNCFECKGVGYCESSETLQLSSVRRRVHHNHKTL